MRAEVGLHNSARFKVVAFVFKDFSGPRSGVLPKAMVVHFRALDEHVVTFLTGFPNNVSITKIQNE